MGVQKLTYNSHNYYRPTKVSLDSYIDLNSSKDPLGPDISVAACSMLYITIHLTVIKHMFHFTFIVARE